MVTTLLRNAGDKLLQRLVPRSRASACTYYSWCAFQFKGCGGPYCYYYYQWGSYCYVTESQGGCENSMRRYKGCC